MWSRKRDPGRAANTDPSFLARWRRWLTRAGVGLTLTLVAGVLLWQIAGPGGPLALWAITQILRGAEPPPITAPGPPLPPGVTQPDPTSVPDGTPAVTRPDPPGSLSGTPTATPVSSSDLSLEDFADPPDANDSWAPPPALPPQGLTLADCYKPDNTDTIYPPWNPGLVPQPQQGLTAAQRDTFFGRCVASNLPSPSGWMRTNVDVEPAMTQVHRACLVSQGCDPVTTTVGDVDTLQLIRFQPLADQYEECDADQQNCRTRYNVFCQSTQTTLAPERTLLHLVLSNESRAWLGEDLPRNYEGYVGVRQPEYCLNLAPATTDLTQWQGQWMPEDPGVWRTNVLIVWPGDESGSKLGASHSCPGWDVEVWLQDARPISGP